MYSDLIAMTNTSELQLLEFNRGRNQMRPYRELKYSEYIEMKLTRYKHKTAMQNKCVLHENKGNLWIFLDRIMKSM